MSNNDMTLTELDQLIAEINPVSISIDWNDHGGANIKMILPVTHPMYGNYAYVSNPTESVTKALLDVCKQAKGIIAHMEGTPQ